MSAPKLTDEELRHLAKTWFEEAHERSAKDDAEFNARNKGRNQFLQAVGALLPTGNTGDGGGGGGAGGDCGDGSGD